MGPPAHTPNTSARLAQALMRSHGDGSAMTTPTALSRVNDVTLGSYRAEAATGGHGEFSRQGASRPGSARGHQEAEKSTCSTEDLIEIPLCKQF